MFAENLSFYQVKVSGTGKSTLFHYFVQLFLILKPGWRLPCLFYIEELYTILVFCRSMLYHEYFCLSYFCRYSQNFAGGYLDWSNTLPNCTPWSLTKVEVPIFWGRLWRAFKKSRFGSFYPVKKKQTFFSFLANSNSLNLKKCFY